MLQPPQAIVVLVQLLLFGRPVNGSGAQTLSKQQLKVWQITGLQQVHLSQYLSVMALGCTACCAIAVVLSNGRHCIAASSMMES
jgi:hypothetical protein